jgi:hypothetical protein
MFDAWTFYWGLVDVHGNGKLAYTVAQSCYQPVYISGLHGGTLLRSGEEIEVTVSNYAEALDDASLQVRVRDRSGHALKEQTFIGLAVPGDVALSTVAHMAMAGMEPGLYSIEYYLHTKAGNQVAKTVELFFVEG